MFHNCNCKILCRKHCIKYVFQAQSFHSNLPNIFVGIRHGQCERRLVTSFCTTCATKAKSGCSNKLNFWGVVLTRNFLKAFLAPHPHTIASIISTQNYPRIRRGQNCYFGAKWALFSPLWTSKWHGNLLGQQTKFELVSSKLCSFHTQSAVGPHNWILPWTYLFIFTFFLSGTLWEIDYQKQTTKIKEVIWFAYLHFSIDSGQQFQSAASVVRFKS